MRKQIEIDNKVKIKKYRKFPASLLLLKNKNAEKIGIVINKFSTIKGLQYMVKFSFGSYEIYGEDELCLLGTK